MFRHMQHNTLLIGAILFATGIYLAGCKESDNRFSTGKNWPAYGGNKAGNRYSPLGQITRDNVKNLEVAWMYDAGNTQRGDIQCQPIVIDGILYGTTPDLQLFALDAGSGRQVWRFAPPAGDRPNHNRGVAYWESGADKRILYTVGSGLYAVNAATGKLVAGFGKEGRADLHQGLQTIPGYDISQSSVNATSPGVVYKNTFIIGSTVSEGGDAAPGHIRAFDVVTGKLAWVFHTIPQPGEFGYDTWPKDAYKQIGAVNCWSGMTLDEKRGLVFFGTGSPASDYYGGDRAGANLFANCIVALDAQTGTLKWYYQTIHHDLWDRDQPCAPNLATVTHQGKKTDVVVQATKDGLVYVLDRDSGRSLFPVEERPVPVKGLPGEQPYPTQKFPLLPAPFTRQVYTEADLPDPASPSYTNIRERYAHLQSANKFTPPDTIGTLLFGYSGGAEWGGNAVDPGGILYQNANEEPWELVMQNKSAVLSGDGAGRYTAGHALYLQYCAACHGQDRQGSGSEFPSLVNIEKKRPADDIKNLLKTGYGRMPQFLNLSEGERNRIVSFVTNTEKEQPGTREQASNALNVPKAGGSFPYQPAYKIRTWKQFTGPDGYPGIKPPWGTLNAIDLNTGAYLWKVPLGEYPELAKKGVPTTGTVSYGGPLVTAGGLLFIGGTKDEKFRAIDCKTGKTIWEYQLPAGGFATPVTYEVAGKQYVVIAAGGGRNQQPGGNYIAFRLKQ